MFLLSLFSLFATIVGATDPAVAAQPTNDQIKEFMNDFDEFDVNKDKYLDVRTLQFDS